MLGTSQRGNGPQGLGFGRLTGIAVAGQVSWLLPMAIFGLAAGVWLSGRRVRGNRALAGWLMFGAWLLVSNIVFSSSSGTFHSYYTVQLAPAIAAMAGAGAVALWRLGETYRWLRWALPVVVVVNAWWALVLLGRTSYFAAWLVWPLGFAAAIGAIGLLLGPRLGKLGLTYAVRPRSLASVCCWDRSPTRRRRWPTR